MPARHPNGAASNDILHEGPNLLADTGGLLIRFRLFPVALVADIKQVRKQIEVIEPHGGFKDCSGDGWNKREPLEMGNESASIWSSIATVVSAQMR